MKALTLLSLLALALAACGRGPNRDQAYAKAVDELTPERPPAPKVKPTVQPGQEEPLVGHYVQTADDPPPFPELGHPSPPSGDTTVELVDLPPESVNPLTGPPTSERRDYSAYGDEHHYR